MNYKPPEEHELETHWSKVGNQLSKLAEVIESKNINDLSRVSKELENLTYKIQRHNAIVGK